MNPREKERSVKTIPEIRETFGKACAHPERATIDRALGAGQSPRSLVRRYAGLNRKAVQKHRDGCLVGAAPGGGA